MRVIGTFRDTAGPATTAFGLKIFVMMGLIVGGIAQSGIVCLSAIVASHAFMFVATRVKTATAR